MLSSNFITELVTKFQTQDSGLAGACADMIHSMFKFIILQSKTDEKDEDEIMDEPEIPEEYMGMIMATKKLDLNLAEFLDTFAFNIPKLLKFLLSPVDQ